MVKRARPEWELSNYLKFVHGVFRSETLLYCWEAGHLPELGKRDIHCIWPILLLEAQEQMLQHQLKSTYCYAQLLRTKKYKIKMLQNETSDKSAVLGFLILMILRIQILIPTFTHIPIKAR